MELGGQADAVVFTAGIGENAASVRGAIVDGLQGLGILADAAKARAGGMRCRDSVMATSVIACGMSSSCHRL